MSDGHMKNQSLGRAEIKKYLPKEAVFWQKMKEK
jgi:hypothetical protein